MIRQNEILPIRFLVVERDMCRSISALHPAHGGAIGCQSAAVDQLTKRGNGLECRLVGIIYELNGFEPGVEDRLD
jgi:hypothetical protein